MWLGPWLALGTLVSEDASTLSAGVLVASQALSPIAAIAWVGGGIWCGDVGLFMVGRIARRIGPLARWIDRRWSPADLAQAAARLDRGVPVAVLLSRFTPGTRLPLYVACGVFPVRAVVFAASTLAASLLWSSVVVLGVSWIGGAAW